jgi:hypothetical protein
MRARAQAQAQADKSFLDLADDQMVINILYHFISWRRSIDIAESDKDVETCT